jgi:protein phosphatase 1L
MMYNRVGGVLAVTRALGDFSLKSFGVTSTPFLKSLEIRIIHKYIVVASDGLWDVVSENVNYNL